MWPWRAALLAALAVDLIIGAVRHFDFAGIEGFSTTNYGWLAFSLVGGVGLAWRLARRPAGWWLLVRPLVASAMTFVSCFLAVTLMGLMFLPHQPVTETVTTDAPGRAIWLSLLVAIVGCGCEALWLPARWLNRAQIR
jgi:hypothetical protein